MSPIASHLLVACATQHPAIRLVDLRSGASAQALTGHSGAVLSLAWSPTNDNILASGSIDGSVRIWDVRRSSATLGLLDMEDSIGVNKYGLRPGGRAREFATAHAGPVNGLTWTNDGSYIISAGHDQRVRVWNAASGANTLASFGPILKNSQLSNTPLLVSPTGTTKTNEELLFFPNEHELLMFELHEGRLLKRLKVPGVRFAAIRSRNGERNVRNRIMALGWRGPADGIITGHSDGIIRAWLPRDRDDEQADSEMIMKEEVSADADERKRKRSVLDNVFQDLTKQKITFG
jgi:DNA excision repair protein ERCC-8